MPEPANASVGDAEGVIDTATTVCRRRPDGIVANRAKPGARVDHDDAAEIIRATAALMPGRLPCPVLVVLGGTQEVTRAARQFFANSEEASRVISRVAFIVESPLSRVIASVFLGLKKPRYPSAMFGTEAEAVAWLLSSRP